MYLSITTLNVNGLNTPSKRHRVPECIRNIYIYMVGPPRDPPQIKRYRLKVKGWKKIFHANGKKKSWRSSTYI